MRQNMTKSIVAGLFMMVFMILSANSQEKVSVAAASNISSIAVPLQAAFSADFPAYKIEFTFGASGALATQILNGAPFQVFLSADTSFPQKLVDAKMTSGATRVYAVGKLIFLTTKTLDLSRGLSVLLDASIAQFANSNPETAPYGRAAQEALVKTGLLDKVKGKLVTAQTVTQALQFTLTSVDAGFVNKSALYSAELKAWNKEGTYWFEVDPTLYAPIEQGFVVVKSAASLPAVTAFSTFLLSPHAQAVFASYGYGTP